MLYCAEELTMTGSEEDIDILEEIFRVKVPLNYRNPSSTPLSEMVNDKEAKIIDGDAPSDSIDQYPKSHIWIDHIGGAYSRETPVLPWDAESCLRMRVFDRCQEKDASGLAR